MPCSDGVSNPSDNIAQNFASYLERRLDNQFHGDGTASAPEGHELLFSRNWFFNRGTSLHFGPKRWWWVRRQVNRLRTRSEVARLIDAQFGDDEIIVTKRRFFADETIGDRIMKDSATDSGFSFDLIDDAALAKIDRRIQAVKGTIAQYKEDRPYDAKVPFRISREALERIYARADSASRPQADLSSGDASHFGPQSVAVTNLAPVGNQVLGDSNIAASVSSPWGRHIEEGWLPEPLPDAEESYRLGRLYNDKNSPDYDRYKALCCFIRAEQQGHKDLQGDYRIGGIYEVIRPNYDWQIDVPFGVYKVYRDGADGVRRDPDRAAHWLSVSAAYNQQDARDELRRLARRGDPDLQFGLYKDQRDHDGGIWFRRGHYKRGVQWLLRAAEQGHEEALNELDKIKRDLSSEPGLLRVLRDVYREGIDGVDPDQDEAVRWEELANGGGRSEAEYSKFRHCLIANESPWKRAQRLVRRLAQSVAHGDETAQGEIDNAIENGPGDLLIALSHVFREGTDGVPQDIDQACLLLVAAVDQGHQEAAQEFARLVREDDPDLYVGIYQRSLEKNGVVETPFRVFCLLKAAALGHDKAQAIIENLKQRGSAATRFVFSEFYRHGLDPVRVDNAESERWFSGPDVPELAKSLELLGWHLDFGPRQFDARAGKWIKNENHAPTSEDVQKAVDYYTRAIEQSNPNEGLSYPHGLRDLTRLVNSLEEDVTADLQHLIGRTTERWQQDPEDVGTAASWYLGAAKAGHAEAQYKMFRLYRDGTGVRQDLPTALRYLVLAAEQQHETAPQDLREIDRSGPAEVQFALGELYRSGADGIEANTEEAANCYRRAAFSGHPAAQYMYGMCNKDGVGVQQDLFEAAFWLAHAAQNNSRSAIKELKAIKKDGETALQFEIAELYRTGGGEVQPDFRKAAGYLDKAAHSGHTLAQYQYGLCKKEGRGVPQDFSESAYWLTVAAKNEHWAAIEELDRIKNDVSTEMQFALGELYRTGAEGVKTNPGEAAEFYKCAALYGHLAAQYRYGMCNKEGAGVHRNFHVAAQWLVRAAQNGHWAAYWELDTINHEGPSEMQFALGELYRKGADGVKRNSERAIYYYLYAARSGHAAAQYRCGICNKDGVGVPSNPSEAALWLVRAAQNTYQAAREELDTIKHRGPSEMQFALGELYRNGADGIEPDDDEAASYYQRASLFNYAPAQYQFGMCKKEGRGTDRDLSEAISLLVRSARGRHAPAIAEIETIKRGGAPDEQFALGESYYQRANGNRTDLREASGLFQTLANQGHAGAQYRLGLMYRDGQVPQAYTIQADLQAAIWLFRAAHQGHEEAVQTVNDVKRNGSPALRFALRELHAYGFENIPPDVRTASAFHSGPDEPAHADVLYGLGRLYQEGGLGADRLGIGGLEVDTLEAVDYFRRAIDQGQRWDALNALEKVARANEGPASLYCEIGQIHEEGRGWMPVDLRTARLWYERAAEEGYADAQYRLAGCLLKGNRPDVSRAMLWLSRAVGNGARDAVVHLQRIAEKGPAAQQLALARAYEQAVERRPPAEENNAMAFDGMQLFAQREREQERAEAIRQSKNTQLLKQAAGWYGRAAARGNAEAQYQYAICCREGREGGRDEGQYVRWLTRSAENGHRDAQFALALFYQAAREQYDLADKAFIHWLRLAAAQRHELAGDLVATLNIGPDRPLRNQDTNPPGWWPSAMRLIDDEVNQLTALALVEAQRADAPLQDEAAAGIAGVDNIDNEEPADGDDEELVQQAFAVLIDVFEALRRRGEFNPSTDLEDSLNSAQWALDEQLRVLNQNEEEGTAGRRQELTNLKETLEASLQLANEIQDLRRRNRSDTEGVLNAMAKDRGLLPHE